MPAVKCKYLVDTKTRRKRGIESIRVYGRRAIDMIGGLLSKIDSTGHKSKLEDGLISDLKLQRRSIARLSQDYDVSKEFIYPGLTRFDYDAIPFMSFTVSVKHKLRNYYKEVIQPKDDKEFETEMNNFIAVLDAIETKLKCIEFDTAIAKRKFDRMRKPLTFLNLLYMSASKLLSLLSLPTSRSIERVADDVDMLTYIQEQLKTMLDPELAMVNYKVLRHGLELKEYLRSIMFKYKLDTLEPSPIEFRFLKASYMKEELINEYKEMMGKVKDGK